MGQIGTAGRWCSDKATASVVVTREVGVMEVRLAYGRDGLTLRLPERAVIVEPVDQPGLLDEAAAMGQALRAPLERPPLAELVRPADRVVIVHSDLTRPAPNERMLPVILAELAAAGLPDEQITLLNATGLHRPNTEAELRQMLGDRLVERYRCINHDAHDHAGLRWVGRTPGGAEVWLNHHYVEADRRITTGFIEPHFFAGFSGGAKSVLPGVAGDMSVMHNHNAELIAAPGSVWGETALNPIMRESRAAAALCPPDLILNVTLNKWRQITGVFCGELIAAHDAGCASVKQGVMRPVERPFDIVVTTNSGFPLDLNLYQAVKGMSAAAQIVRPGGAIIIAAECSDGVGHGPFLELLASRPDPQGLLDRITTPGFAMFDQWQVQLLAQILLKARVYLYAPRLGDEAIRAAHLRPSHSIEATIAELEAEWGGAARLCVLPQGPLTVPYIATPALVR
jgi:nickel-dependent lactate racemase